MGFRLANVGGRGALVDGDHYYDLEELADGALSPDPMAALTFPDLLAELASGLGGRQPTGLLTGATLGPPVPRPRNSYGVGLNYRSHAEEASMEIPDVPLVFTKFPSCITGPFDEVRLRRTGATTKVNWLWWSAQVAPTSTPPTPGTMSLA